MLPAMQTYPGQGSTPPLPPPSPPPMRRDPRDKSEVHLEQIRNILGWILFLMVLSMAGSIVAGIYVIHQTASQGQAVSNCQSLGGTDPAC